MIDSTNLQAPFFGPEWPIYPHIDHIVRVYGAALAGNVYTSFIQQWNPLLILRDREAVYVWEPNGVPLGPGYYDARLVGSYMDLPLLVTWCCSSGAVPAGSSVSSSSGSSSSFSPSSSSSSSSH